MRARSVGKGGARGAKRRGGEVPSLRVCCHIRRPSGSGAFLVNYPFRITSDLALSSYTPSSSSPPADVTRDVVCAMPDKKRLKSGRRRVRRARYKCGARCGVRIEFLRQSPLVSDIVSG